MSTLNPQRADVMRDGDYRGVDPWRAAETAFPGTPTDVIAAAWVDYEDRKTEAWWQQVEKTIDGEIIRRALTIQG